MIEPIHTTTIHTETAPTKITVELGGDGRWFKVLNDLIDDGTAAALKGDGLLLLLIHLRHRGPDGFSRLTIDDLCRHSQRHRSTVFRAHDQLQTAKPMLLKRVGDAIWEPFPGREFMGKRSQSCDPPSRSPATPSRNSATPPQGTRAPNQPTKDRESKPDLHPGRLVGWQGIGLFWEPRSMRSPDELLRALRVSGRLLEQTLGLPGITVDEIAAEAERIAQDRTVENPPACLAHRLAAARGVAKPRPAPGPHDDVAQRLVQLRRAKAGANLPTFLPPPRTPGDSQ